MRSRDEIAKDANCTESEYKNNINVRIELLTLEVLIDIRDHNDRIISLLQDVARGNNVTLASNPRYGASTSIIMSKQM